jgi:hypothetical protein
VSSLSTLLVRSGVLGHAHSSSPASAGVETDFYMKPQAVAQLLAAGLGGIVVLAGAVWLCASHAGREAVLSAASLDALLGLPASALCHISLAKINLLCAQGLPGAHAVGLGVRQAELDKMAARLRTSTGWHRWPARPCRTHTQETIAHVNDLTL